MVPLLSSRLNPIMSGQHIHQPTPILQTSCIWLNKESSFSFHLERRTLSSQNLFVMINISIWKLFIVGIIQLISPMHFVILIPERHEKWLIFCGEQSACPRHSHQELICYSRQWSLLYYPRVL